jgi:hypothetical protein
MPSVGAASVGSIGGARIGAIAGSFVQMDAGAGWRTLGAVSPALMEASAVPLPEWLQSAFGDEDSDEAEPVPDIMRRQGR